MTANGSELVKRVGKLDVQGVKLDALAVPNIKHTLVSVSSLDRRGMTTVFTQGKCFVLTNCPVLDEKKILIKGTLVDGLYEVDRKLKEETAMSAQEAQLWHARMGHLNGIDVTKLREVTVGAATNHWRSKYKNPVKDCEHCLKGKAHRLPTRRSEKLPEMKVGQRIHSDVCGMFPPSRNGERYFVTYVDDKSKFVRGYALKTKDEQVAKYKELTAYLEARDIKCAVSFS
jgi:hypothetical protein